VDAPGTNSTAPPAAGTGPVPKAARIPRTAGIFVRVTPAEHRLLQLLARYRRDSVAGLVRHVALDQARATMSEILATSRAASVGHGAEVQPGTR
jgi:hypothetical protein